MIVQGDVCPYLGEMLAKHASKTSEAPLFDTDVTVRWSERVANLQRMIREQPNSEWAWLWRTRLTVLCYLTHRYAAECLDAGELGDASAYTVPDLAEAFDSVQEPTTPYDHLPYRYKAMTPQDLERANDRQARLASLQRTNSSRHAKAEKIAAQLKKLAVIPTRQKAQGKEQLAQALEGMDEREFKRLRKHIAFDLGLLELSDEVLDEETVRMILLEHGIEPDEHG